MSDENREREDARRAATRRSWERNKERWRKFNAMNQEEKDAERARQGLRPYKGSAEVLAGLIVDDEHVRRVQLRASHKQGKHARVFVDECPECKADADVLRSRGGIEKAPRKVVVFEPQPKDEHRPEHD